MIQIQNRKIGVVVLLVTIASVTLSIFLFSSQSSFDNDDTILARELKLARSSKMDEIEYYADRFGIMNVCAFGSDEGSFTTRGLVPVNKMESFNDSFEYLPKLNAYNCRLATEHDGKICSIARVFQIPSTSVEYDSLGYCPLTFEKFRESDAKQSKKFVTFTTPTPLISVTLPENWRKSLLNTKTLEILAITDLEFDGNGIPITQEHNFYSIAAIRSGSSAWNTIELYEENVNLKESANITISTSEVPLDPKYLPRIESVQGLIRQEIRTLLSSPPFSASSDSSERLPGHDFVYTRKKKQSQINKRLFESSRYRVSIEQNAYSTDAADITIFIDLELYVAENYHDVFHRASDKDFNRYSECLNNGMEDIVKKICSENQIFSCKPKN